MKHVLGWMQPRDHALARRTVVALVLVATVVSLVTAPLAPAGRGLTPLSIVVLVTAAGVLVLLVALGSLLDEVAHVAWAVVPLACVALLTAVDLLTSDASLNAQIFFVFPAIYGASLLTRAGAVVMLAASIAGEAAVVASLHAWQSAVVELVYVSAALATTTAILVRSGERQAALTKELSTLAAIDSLTGLVTRRVLDEAATAALSGASNDEGTSLMLLDVDQFKAINDRHGHPGGDEVLVQLAEIIRRRSRPSDVVCRMGGDELAMLLPGCATHVAEARAAQLLADVRATSFTTAEDGVRVSVTVSIGVAHAPSHALDLRSLYAAADAALYRAKESGRDRVVSPARLT